VRPLDTQTHTTMTIAIPRCQSGSAALTGLEIQTETAPARDVPMEILRLQIRSEPIDGQCVERAGDVLCRDVP
jgi:hypothetical protein